MDKESFKQALDTAGIGYTEDYDLFIPVAPGEETGVSVLFSETGLLTAILPTGCTYDCSVCDE